MSKMRFITLLFIIFFVLVGCRSKKRIVTTKDKTETKEIVTPPKSKEELRTEVVGADIKIPASTLDYIQTFKDIAIREMKIHKIPASITLAQGILESGSGRGRLAREANNHFGIKCHGWTGNTIYHDDDLRQECFRKYQNPEQSFEDHSTFLVSRKRYSKLFTLDINDYKGWARELRKAGYATDKRYPEKLIGIIERYNLHQFDLNNEQIESPGFHIVSKGDTLFSIAKRYNVSLENLKQWNQLDDSTIIVIGQELKIKEN